MMRHPEHDQIVSWLDEGVSLSEAARRVRKTPAWMSTYCKKHGLKSSHSPTQPKQLDLAELHRQYSSGVSMYKLGLQYRTPPQTLKRRLLQAYPDLQTRTMDEAKRPEVLNSAERLGELMASHSLRAIGRKLKVKAATVCAAVRRLGLSEGVRRTIQHIPTEEFTRLYEEHGLSLTEIARAYRTYPTSILNRLHQAGVQLRPSGGVRVGSKIELLNDRERLEQVYHGEQRTMAYIAALVGTSVGNVAHHIRQLGIRPRTRQEAGRLRLRQQSAAASTTVDTVWGEFKVKSQKERQFLENLPCDTVSVQYEPVELQYANRGYNPDFLVDGQYVEVKPKAWGQKAGVDRRKFAHQLRIAERNGVELKTWYSGYYDYEPLGDDDKFYAVDWRLWFDDCESCLEFLRARGWTHPRVSYDQLIKGVTGWMRVPEANRWNANVPKPRTIGLMRHFHPNYYRSAHKGYSAVSAAFEPGNLSVLRAALHQLWERPNSCNIYGLVQTISLRFKDFAMVGMFKPWVARAVYERLLPGGGTVVDPCCGWGGRMLACVESEYRYVGSDLNQTTVTGNEELARFAGNRFVHRPELAVRDATTMVMPGDLLFTSPPYDDTERYHGIDSGSTVTLPIYERIFRDFPGVVALNVPRRHVTQVRRVAGDFGWSESEPLEMKTGAFISREMTTEPILVFQR